MQCCPAINRYWLHESLQINRCKAFCKILVAGEEVLELGAKGTTVLFWSSRFWTFYLILCNVHGICGCGYTYALFLSFFLDYPTILSEQPYTILCSVCVSKYAQCLQAGSMQEETIFHQCSFSALEVMKYFRYDNKNLNKMESNLQRIFIYEFC